MIETDQLRIMAAGLKLIRRARPAKLDADQRLRIELRAKGEQWQPIGYFEKEKQMNETFRLLMDLPDTVVARAELI